MMLQNVVGLFKICSSGTHENTPGFLVRFALSFLNFLYNVQFVISLPSFCHDFVVLVLVYEVVVVNLVCFLYKYTYVLKEYSLNTFHQKIKHINTYFCYDFKSRASFNTDFIEGSMLNTQTRLQLSS